MADTPVICLLGPRQSGKTTLVRQLEPERAYVSLDDNNYYQTAASGPSRVLWQVYRMSSLWMKCSALQCCFPPSSAPSMKIAVLVVFLLTGSANLLLLPKVTESLAGRMEVIQLQPLTEAEKMRQPGLFVNALLEGAFNTAIRPETQTTEPTLTERLMAGGYPEPLTRSPVRARQWRRQYLHTIIERDVQDVARVRDSHELARLLELLAVRNAQLFNASNLANSLGLHRDTVDHYVSVLERLFLVRRLPAWHRNTGKRLIKSPKLHLVDSGLAATLAGPQRGRLAQKTGTDGTFAGVIRGSAAYRAGCLDRSGPPVLALS